MADDALDPRRSVAVSASAGSGKTWQLAARITRLLLAGAKPAGILALTFTRKSAAEMQARVMQRLRALALAADDAATQQLREIGVEAGADLLARARGLYEELLFTPWPLRALTLHAFCQDLIARFALYSGTPPGFELIEDEGLLCDAAWQGLQRELLSGRDEATTRALATLIADGCSENQLRGIVIGFLDRRNDWRALTEHRDDPPGLLRQHLQQRLGVDERVAASAGVDADAFSARLRMFCGHLHTAEGVIEQVRLDRLLPAFDEHGLARLQTLLGALFTQDGNPRKFKIGARKQSLLGSGAAAHCEELHRQLIHELTQARELMLRQDTLRRTLAAATLGAAALRHFERELQERAVLSFAELEWRACALLRDPEAGHWVQYRLDARIEHLLVDEFQDTSDAQWQLLRPLLQEMADSGATVPAEQWVREPLYGPASAPTSLRSGTVMPARGDRERSAFIVGDSKQSIYGFRRANPQLMHEAERWLTAHLGGVRSELSASRRSAPAIIDFVNALFTQPEALALLPEFPRHSTHQTALWGRVELAPLVTASARKDEPIAFRNPLTTPRADPENQRAWEEGALIARRIRALMDARWQISHKDGARAIAYGDMMIVLRKRTHQRALERALADAGIPFVGSARGTLLQTVEARDLGALLRFLASPVRDLDLAHALRSPLFACSDTDLAALARSTRAENISWWTALARSTQPQWQRAQRLLAQWLQAARRLPAHDLLDRILCEADVVARYEAALPPAQAARLRANLGAYLQLALEADSGRYPSLSKFLRQLESASAAPDEAPPPAQAGAVRILTIHAAKGLEAPAVFIAQAAGSAGRSGSGWLVNWPPGAERPLDFLLAASAEARDACSAQLLQAQHAREAAEEMNLLYVACTRARQFLHVSGFELQRGGGNWFSLAQGALGALLAREEDGVFVHAQGDPAPAPMTPAQAAPPAVTDPRLRRALALAKPAAPAPGAQTAAPDAQTARRGNAIHRLLQLLGENAGSARLKPAVEARLNDSVPAREFEQWLAEARAVVAAPALQPFFDRTRIRRAWNEVPLPHSEGVIDRLVDDGECLWILDYKSQREARAEDLLVQYRAQLLAYREGVRRLWPQRRVRAGLVLTATAAWIELPE